MALVKHFLSQYCKKISWHRNRSVRGGDKGAISGSRVVFIENSLDSVLKKNVKLTVLNEGIPSCIQATFCRERGGKSDRFSCYLHSSSFCSAQRRRVAEKRRHHSGTTVFYMSTRREFGLLLQEKRLSGQDRWDIRERENQEIVRLL